MLYLAVVDGAQHKEIGFPISTDNASWGRGPNTKAGGKSAYINVQVGVGPNIKKYFFFRN
ncbi:hypothetical protein A4P28_08260 [Staphylococcus aureus]|nr:hypothetical protein A4P28_08260 [Staphylococcus aureus]